MILKLSTLSLWLLALTTTLFVLATDVWQGDPLWRFVGATLLGVIGPLGTWSIVKRYPETDWFAFLGDQPPKPDITMSVFLLSHSTVTSTLTISCFCVIILA